MKSKLYVLLVVLFSAAVLSCSEEEEKRKGDPDLTHEGVKWNIASVSYLLIDQNTSGSVSQVYKQGTKENAGSFYFVDGATKGSFEMNVEGYNKEDAFNYSLSNQEMSILTVEQQVGGGIQTNQNVIIINGSAADTEMSLSGSIIKQSTTGQFMLQIDEMVLVKQ